MVAGLRAAAAGGLIGLLLGPGGAGAQTLRGVVSESPTYAPIDLATVTLTTTGLDTIAQTVTDERGFFAFTAGEGEFFLFASALGYGPVRSDAVTLASGELKVVELTMSPQPVSLGGLLVETEGAEPVIPGLAGTGFYQRLAEGRGEFILPGEIAASPAKYTQQLFWNQRFVRVHQRSHERPGPWNDVLRMPNRRGAGYCDPAVFIDGIALPELLPNESIADAVPRGELEAVEIYDASIWVPPEYANRQAYGFQEPARAGEPIRPPCGMILFWTRAR